MSENIIDNLIAEGRRMAENETEADILAEMQTFKCRNLSTGELEECTAISKYLANRIEAARKREVDALKQRCAELNAEVAAKDEVIKRLNDALAEEQRRKMTTAENSSAVGNAAKLREALLRQKQLLQTIYSRGSVDKRELCAGMGLIDAALAAPARNCDVGTAKNQTRRFSVFCGNHDQCMTDDSRCPLIEKQGSCEFEWAQMPYEEGGAK